MNLVLSSLRKLLPQMQSFYSGDVCSALNKGFLHLKGTKMCRVSSLLNEVLHVVAGGVVKCYVKNREALSLSDMLEDQIWNAPILYVHACASQNKRYA